MNEYCFFSLIIEIFTVKQNKTSEYHTRIGKYLKHVALETLFKKLNDTDTIYSTIGSRRELTFFMHLYHISRHTVPDHSIDTSFALEMITMALNKQSKYTQHLNNL